MALLISRVIEGPLLFADTETLIRAGLLRTQQSRSKRPDYFAVAADDRTRTYVIEAKGTQQGERYCREEQLVRGCEQVAAVGVVAPSTPSPMRYVVGSSLRSESSESPSRVFIADPPEIDAHAYVFAGPLKEVVPVVHYLHIARLIGDEALENVIVERDLARPFGPLWPGPRLRGDQTHEAPGWQGPIRRTQSREYVGSEVTFRSPVGEVNCFIGLRHDIRQQLVEGNVHDAIQLAADRDAAADLEFANSAWAKSGKDGTVLICRIA